MNVPGVVTGGIHRAQDTSRVECEGGVEEYEQLVMQACMGADRQFAELCWRRMCSVSASKIRAAMHVVTVTSY